MRLLRSLSACLALAMAISVVTLDGRPARAQESDDAEQAAQEAAERAETAEGLVDAAIANREGLEVELAVAIARVNDLSADLSRVAVDIDNITEMIAFADLEMSGIEAAIETQAVDAYMKALATPAVTLVYSDSVEAVMVTGVVVEQIVGSGRETVDRLVAQKRSLEALHLEQLEKQDEFLALKADLDAEMDHLTSLYEEADAEVAQRIRDANAADAEYRAALSEVEAARARDAEQTRQRERDPPTTTTTEPSSEPPPPTTATTAPPPTSPPTTSGGGWVFPPAVEQWRGLVSQYFPASRVDEALRIIQCESLGDPNAYNPYSGASGLFQFIPSTWATTAPKAGFPNASPFDPVANIASAAWLANRYQELGQYYWQPWSCRRVL